MSIDAIGNFLTILRNGIMSSKPHVIAPYSRIKHTIAEILHNEGFIKSIDIINVDNSKKNIKITLKYVDGECALHCIDRVSKLSRRVYKGINNLDPVIGGLGISILTTNKGVITHRQARQLGVGGEVICTVW
ncbi:MAG: 30S ribosomal protein S8 [Candidatus Babeliaceae bacterium]|jgi:small subunit ribosomal protein S8